jgi:hypothetical protein
MNRIPECKIQAYNSARRQNTFYDEKNNEMLYGRSNLMRASGVSDGTCNQINPLMLRHSARCGVGAAGGNPCYPNSLEPFEQESLGCNITGFVTLLFFVLIILLFINVHYFESIQ